MPDTPAPRLGAQGALLSTPISLTSLDPEDQKCPICHESYIEPSSSDDIHDNNKEWPVSVDMAAQWSGLKRCCGHILGRRCLEKHLQASGAWRNKCPICRDLWFDNTTETDDATPGERSHAEIGSGNQPPSPLRRNSRIATRASIRRSASGARMSDRHGIRRPPPHPPIRLGSLRPNGFMQQLLDTLEVEKGSHEVKSTLEEVERRLELWYDGLQQRLLLRGRKDSSLSYPEF